MDEAAARGNWVSVGCVSERMNDAVEISGGNKRRPSRPCVPGGNTEVSGTEYGIPPVCQCHETLERSIQEQAMAFSGMTIALSFQLEAPVWHRATPGGDVVIFHASASSTIFPQGTFPQHS